MVIFDGGVDDDDGCDVHCGRDERGFMMSSLMGMSNCKHVGLYRTSAMFYHETLMIETAICHSETKL